MRCITRIRWNYLRVRGEYLEIASHAVIIQELPPRARRIRHSIAGCKMPTGTTSACAENTSHPFTNGSNIWNYLRVRGEYGRLLSSVGSLLELPPRARRILPPAVLDALGGGTTSACAENTDLVDRLEGAIGNYLRVRGEYPK